MWKSIAMWPKEAGVPTSEDTHPTEENAKAICGMLRREGFGGDRQIFPLQTFVEDPTGNVVVV